MSAHTLKTVNCTKHLIFCLLCFMHNDARGKSDYNYSMENSLKAEKFSRELNGYKFKCWGWRKNFVFCRKQISNVKDFVERNNNKMQTLTQSMHVHKRELFNRERKAVGIELKVELRVVLGEITKLRGVEVVTRYINKKIRGSDWKSKMGSHFNRLNLS